MWHRYAYSYDVRAPRNPWPLFLFGALALAAGVIIVSLLIALVASAAVVALVLGGAWLGWHALRSVLAPPRRQRARGRRLTRETRGLMEMAATPDPVEQYLYAVREFERISMSALELRPEDAGRRRVAKRAGELTEQARALTDTVNEVERRLVVDRRSEGMIANVWELSLASRDVEGYLYALARTPRNPDLAETRVLVSRRATLAARRTGLVERLDNADVTPTAGFRSLH